jgi:hypothetical protein
MSCALWQGLWKSADLRGTSGGSHPGRRHSMRRGSNAVHVQHGRAQLASTGRALVRRQLRGGFRRLRQQRARQRALQRVQRPARQRRWRARIGQTARRCRAPGALPLRRRQGLVRTTPRPCKTLNVACMPAQEGRCLPHRVLERPNSLHACLHRKGGACPHASSACRECQGGSVPSQMFTHLQHQPAHGCRELAWRLEPAAAAALRACWPPRAHPARCSDGRACAAARSACGHPGWQALPEPCRAGRRCRC